MAEQIVDIKRVHTLAATIEAGGIISTQWAFSTDGLQIIVRNGASYYHMAGIEATNTFTQEQTFNAHVNLGAGADILGSPTSDINMNSLFTVAGATGNTVIAGTLGVTGVATFTAQPIVSTLTASLPMFSDGSKGMVSNAMTGTGNVVMNASPTLTGTIGAANLTLSGTLTSTGLITANGGLTLGSGDDLNGSATSDIIWNIDTFFHSASTGKTGFGTASPAALVHLYESDSGTSNSVVVQKIQRVSTGTPVAGFGQSLLFSMEDLGGTADRDAAKIETVWESGTNYDSSLRFHTRTFSGGLTEKVRITPAGILNSDFGITLGANAHLIGSATSDINMNRLFTVAGAPGNVLVGGTLDVTSTITHAKDFTDGTSTTEGFVQRKPAIVQTTDDTVTTLDSFTMVAGYSYIIEAWVVNDSDSVAFVRKPAYYKFLYRAYHSGSAWGGSSLTEMKTDSHNVSSTQVVTLDLSGDTVRLRVTGDVGENVSWAGRIEHFSIDGVSLPAPS